jgi:hypothetical protein
MLFIYYNFPVWVAHYDESKGCHFSANVETVNVTDGMLRVTVPLFSPPPSFMITVPVLNVQRSTSISRSLFFLPPSFSVSPPCVSQPK